jgi:ribosome-associated protein
MQNPEQSGLGLSPKQRAELLLRAALRKKASNPVLIRVAKLSSIADYFLIVSARSGRQVKAVAESIIEDSRSRNMRPLSVEGLQQGNWALLDFGDIIVHVFFEPTREFYDLEGLWIEAPREQLSEDILRELETSDTSDEDDWSEE